ncbi:hypothetical protein [Kitasatospora sp. NPDC004531]
MGWEESAGGDEGERASTARLREPLAALSSRGDNSQLIKDVEMVALLREEGFSGPAWDLYIGDLQRKCRDTVMGWIKNGHLFARAADIGRGVGLEPALRAYLRDDESARHDLASDTMREAARIFRERALENGEWSVHGGATLRSSFLNMVVMQFPNSLRKWAHSEKDRERQYPTGEIALWEDRAQLTDPFKALHDAMELEELGRGEDETIRTMIRLRREGWKPCEIAQELQMTERAAEGKWRRFTEKARARRADGRPA